VEENVTLNKPDADRYFYLRCIPSDQMSQEEREEECEMATNLEKASPALLRELRVRAREICDRRWMKKWKRP
jgi:hypothetical protein